MVDGPNFRPPEQMRVRCYYRGADNQQQQIIVRDFCDAKKWLIVGEYTDATVGGDALQEMLAEASIGETIVTYDIARIARSSERIREIVTSLTNRSVRFVCVFGGIDTDEPRGRAIFAAANFFTRSLFSEP